MRSGDIWSGAVLAALGAYIVVEATNWDYASADGPGPGFFPLWYGAALIALSLGLVVASARKRRGDEAGTPVQWREIGRALAACAAFAVTAALLQVLGFLLGFALLTVFIVCVMYGRPLKTGVAAGVLGAAAFYLVFPLALEVALPVGMLGF